MSMFTNLATDYLSWTNQGAQAAVHTRKWHYSGPFGNFIQTELFQKELKVQRGIETPGPEPAEAGAHDREGGPHAVLLPAAPVAQASKIAAGTPGDALRLGLRVRHVQRLGTQNLRLQHSLQPTRTLWP